MFFKKDNNRSNTILKIKYYYKEVLRSKWHIIHANKSLTCTLFLLIKLSVICFYITGYKLQWCFYKPLPCIQIALSISQTWIQSVAAFYVFNVGNELVLSFTMKKKCNFFYKFKSIICFLLLCKIEKEAI